MASCRFLGEQGYTTIMDTGTTCLQLSPQPGVIGLKLTGNAYPALILVGLAKRNPGRNFDGTAAEDMQYGDMPAKSAKIKEDSMFQKSDTELQAYMRSLMTSLSMGDMETVALEMLDKFIKGTKGNYTSELLNDEIRNNSAFVSYHQAFLKELQAIIKLALYNPHTIKPVSMNLLNFSSFLDKATGLGITVHQVWSAKAELINFSVSDSGRYSHWNATLKYTFYDHFGLDWEDIKKHGDDIFPKYHTGDQFKAWYILQHYRKCRPFITEMSRSVFLSGRAI